ncbi:YecR family lipoprotein [Methyloceanibacter sp. wino2]|uniref:YecR family lipoprotein n=1 Tax=Methyloceanibacter sp. wino2 TaxID=2170729 RepID=UPI000D3E2ECE
MQRVFWVTAITAALAVGGCSTNKTLTPTGGSRSDGTVEMSYEVTYLEKAEINMEQGRTAAKERCRAWGYSDAQAFGGEKRTCQESNSYGCLRYFVSVTYQCLGGGRPS